MAYALILLQTVVRTAAATPANFGAASLWAQIILGLIIIGALVIWLLPKLVRRRPDFKIFLLTVPKYSRAEVDQPASETRVKEVLSHFENLFAAFGALKADRRLSSYLVGRQDHLALEIVARPAGIAFFAALPSC